MAPDAPYDARTDAAVIDAAIDAPYDAAIDAAMIDAPYDAAIDAAMVDAAMIDAAIDAAVDAPIVFQPSNGATADDLLGVTAPIAAAAGRLVLLDTDDGSIDSYDAADLAAPPIVVRP